jgi:hypothetical protein
LPELEFAVSAIVPCEAGHLADWPAETYQVSLETAAVSARRMALAAIRTDVEYRIDPGVEDVKMTFARVSADSYRLVLLPLWLADFDEAGARVPVFVNGQSGAAHVPRASGIAGWLSRLFSP